MIVSLHLENCTNIFCPNIKECYHLKKDFTTQSLCIPKMKLYELLEHKDITIYDSVTDINEYHKGLILYDNYNMTVPVDSCFIDGCFNNSYLKPNVYITVHYGQLFSDQLDAINKIYLYKWIEPVTLDRLYNSANNTHFVFDRETLNASRISEIIQVYMKYREKTTNSIDSCIENLILNGCCPYKNGNYIDITYDNTYRICPFAKQSFYHELPQEETLKESLISLSKRISIDKVRTKCVLETFFERNTL